MYDITYSICEVFSPLYLWHHIYYDITGSIYETTSSMRAAYRLNMWHHSHYLCHHTHWIENITPTLFNNITLAICVASFALYKTSQPQVWPQTTILRTSHLLYLTSCALYLCHHTNSIDYMTATICMISHTVYVRHSIHYINDILPTVYDNTTQCVDYTTLGIGMPSFALQKMSHPLYHTKPQSLWLHIHFRQDITPSVSDIAPTVSLSSQPLHCYNTHFCMTSHALYVWHHMHYI